MEIDAVVTDLDAYLGERALRSLQAELRHRELAFRDAGTSDLHAFRATGAVGPTVGPRRGDCIVSSG